MKINKQQFKQLWWQSSRAESFSEEALDTIFDFFEEESSDYELDYIAIDCSFAEYASEEEAREDFISSWQLSDSFLILN